MILKHKQQFKMINFFKKICICLFIYYLLSIIELGYSYEMVCYMQQTE